MFLSKWWSRPLDLSNYCLLFVLNASLLSTLFSDWEIKMESSDLTFDPVCTSLTQETAVGTGIQYVLHIPWKPGVVIHIWREPLPLKVLISISVEHQRNWECHFLFLIFLPWSVGDDSYCLSPESEARVRVKYALITLHRLFLSFPGAKTHTCRVPSATTKECKRLKIAHPVLDAAFKTRTLGCTTGLRLSVYSKWWANDAVVELSGGYTALVSKIAQWQVVNLSGRHTEARSLEEDTCTILRFKRGSAFKYLQV